MVRTSCSLSLFALTLIPYVGSAQQPEEPKPILQLHFSMDDRNPMKFVHVVEEYALFASGQAYDVSHVYNRGHCASRKHQLDAKAMNQVTDLLNALPVRKEKNIPKELLVTVFVRNDTGKTTELYYRRDALPTEFEKLLELMGGPRNGLKASLKYAKRGK